jgi:SAM-dependent MidA family methyltransferase
MNSSDASPGLEIEIAAEIRERGPIPFARFMEMCLYHPALGYYTRGLGGGGGRDYVTSSGLTAAYGALLARQAEEMWRRTGKPDPWYFVEFGPGEGYFAGDFLREAARSTAFAAALRYELVESSPALRGRQRERLQGRTSIPVSWADEAGLDRRGPFAGCLFANEVLDAFPVHRVVGTEEGAREIHVGLSDGVLCETLGPLSSAALDRFLAESSVAPRPGQEVDVNLAAPCWIGWAVGLLRRGYLVVVDYGHEARDLYALERARGTLLAYHRHRVSEKFLQRPGDQDLTAHLDFTALRRAAEEKGARCLGLTTQSRFLLALGVLEYFPGTDLTREDASPRVPTPIETFREREALKELVLPGRMGDTFRVFVLGVGDVPRDLAGLSRPWERLPETTTTAPMSPPRGGSPAGETEE